MRYQQPLGAAIENIAEDEIDQLFLTELTVLELPPALITRILSFDVRPSPPAFVLQSQGSPLHWDTIERMPYASYFKE